MKIIRNNSVREKREYDNLKVQVARNQALIDYLAMMSNIELTENIENIDQEKQNEGKN